MRGYALVFVTAVGIGVVFGELVSWHVAAGAAFLAVLFALPRLVQWRSGTSIPTTRVTALALVALAGAAILLALALAEFEQAWLAGLRISGAAGLIVGAMWALRLTRRVR